MLVFVERVCTFFVFGISYRQATQNKENDTYIPFFLDLIVRVWYRDTNCCEYLSL